MRYMRVLLALFVSANLLFAGCHGSRQSAAPVAEEYDRPGLNGADPAVGQKIVKEARKWLGTKYVYGGKTRKGTDCSGMVMVVYEQVTGIKLPRDSHSQQAFTEHIKRRDLTPGDLVFFASKAGGSRIGHVGIYIGQGQFIHASSSRGVIISKLDESYYARHFHSAGRVPGVKKGKAKEVKTEVTAPERTDFPIITKPADTLSISLDRLIEISAPDSIAIPSEICEPDSIALEPAAEICEPDTITASVISAFE